MPIHPLANDLLGLLRLVPEKAVAAAVDDFHLGAFDIVAQMFRGRHVVAGVGVDFVFAADDAQRRAGDLVQMLAGLVAVARDDMLQIRLDLRRVVPEGGEQFCQHFRMGFDEGFGEKELALEMVPHMFFMTARDHGS